MPPSGTKINFSKPSQKQRKDTCYTVRDKDIIWARPVAKKRPKLCVHIKIARRKSAGKALFWPLGPAELSEQVHGFCF